MMMLFSHQNNGGNANFSDLDGIKSFLKMNFVVLELFFPTRNSSAVFPLKSSIYNPKTNEKQSQPTYWHFICFIRIFNVN